MPKQSQPCTFTVRTTRTIVLLKTFALKYHIVNYIEEYEYDDYECDDIAWCRCLLKLGCQSFICSFNSTNSAKVSIPKNLPANDFM